MDWIRKVKPVNDKIHTEEIERKAAKSTKSGPETTKLKDYHESVLFQIADEFKQLYGIEADKDKTKDVTRLCFLSFDDNYYANDKAEPFVPKNKVLTRIEPETLPVLKSHSIVYNNKWLENEATIE